MSRSTASNTLHSLTQITLTTADGYALSATRYGAIGAVKGNIVVAGATGVQQRFYRRFAEHAALQGYSVFDS